MPRSNRCLPASTRCIRRSAGYRARPSGDRGWLAQDAPSRVAQGRLAAHPRHGRLRPRPLAQTARSGDAVTGHSARPPGHPANADRDPSEDRRTTSGTVHAPPPARKLDSRFFRQPALMFAFKGSDAIIRFRSGGRGRLGDQLSRIGEAAKVTDFGHDRHYDHQRDPAHRLQSGDDRRQLGSSSSICRVASGASASWTA
jgi:hypothetical protein